MMKTFWALWKTQLNQTFGLSHLKYLYRNNRRRFFRRALYIPFLILALLPLLTLITGMYDSMFAVLHPLGQDAAVFGLAFVFTQTLAMVFGLFYLMSHFYFARDTDLLIPLPLKPSVILGSKFLTVVFSEYLVVFPVVVPALIVYGFSATPGLSFWPLAVLITLLLPVIPLALASIFVMLLMRVTNVSSGRGLMRLIGAFAGISMYMAIQWLQYRFRSVGRGELADLIYGPNGIAHIVARRFPPGFWAAEGLVRFPEPAGLYYLGLFAGTTIVVGFALYFLAEKIFFKGLVGGMEVSAKRKRAAMTTASFKAHSPFKALFIREWRTLIRSISFFIPVLVNTLVLPAALAMPAILSGELTLAGLVGKLRYDVWLQYTVIFATAGLVSWVSTANGIAVTALSREGKTFWISKTLPVSPSLQVGAKLSLALVVSLAVTVLVLAADAALLRLAPGQLIQAGFLALLGSALLACFALFLDVLNPKLDWTDPQQVMKRNFNAVASAFVTMGFLVLNGAFIIVLGRETAFAPRTVYGLVSAVWLVLLAVMALLLFRGAEKRYKKLEL